MLMIRLQRVGRKHEPVFRLVLTDSKNGPKSGRFLEILGSFDARRSEKAEFNIEKVKHWVAKGAQMSDTVHNLFVERKIISGKKINNLPKKSPIISEEAKAAEKAAAEASKVEAVPETPAVEDAKPEEKEESVAEETTV